MRAPPIFVMDSSRKNMPVPSLAYFTYMIIQLIYYCKTR